MAELVDAPASGAGARKGVEVRVLFWAPFTHLGASQNHRQKGGNPLFSRWFCLKASDEISPNRAPNRATEKATVARFWSGGPPHGGPRQFGEFTRRIGSRPTTIGIEDH